MDLVDSETFAEMESMLQDREANTGKSGRPPALPMGAHLLLTLEFWRKYRTFFHLDQEGVCMRRRCYELWSGWKTRRCRVIRRQAH